MTLTLDLVLLIAGFILLVLAGLNISARGLSLGWFGLACWILTAITP